MQLKKELCKLVLVWLSYDGSYLMSANLRAVRHNFLAQECLKAVKSQLLQMTIENMHVIVLLTCRIIDNSLLYANFGAPATPSKKRSAIHSSGSQGQALIGHSPC